MPLSSLYYLDVYESGKEVGTSPNLIVFTPVWIAMKGSRHALPGHLKQSDLAGVVVTTKHHQKVRRWNKYMKLDNDTVVNNDRLLS